MDPMKESEATGGKLTFTGGCGFLRAMCWRGGRHERISSGSQGRSLTWKKSQDR